MPCFFPAMCIYRWTQIFQGRLCYSWKYLLVKSEGFPPRILDHEINYVLPGRKKKETKTHPTTPNKGLGKWISLWMFFSVEVVFLPFHSEKGAWPSWGAGILSFTETVVGFANPADEVQRYFSWEDQRSQHRAGEHTMISCTQPSAGSAGQVLLDSVCRALSVYATAFEGFAQMVGRGLVRRCLICSTSELWWHRRRWDVTPSEQLNKAVRNVWWANDPAAQLYFEVSSCCRFPVVTSSCRR